jgi:hypothetical protein
VNQSPITGILFVAGYYLSQENRGDLNAAELAALFLVKTLVFKKYAIIRKFLSGVGTISPAEKNSIPGLAKGRRSEPGIVRVFQGTGEIGESWI